MIISFIKLIKYEVELFFVAQGVKTLKIINFILSKRGWLRIILVFLQYYS